MKRYFKTFLRGMVVVVILVIVGSSSALVYQYITEILPLKQIETTIEYNKKFCPDEGFPLYIQIKNNSNKTIQNTHFYINVRAKGRSRNLREEWGIAALYMDDKIIEPTKTYANCFRVPHVRNVYKKMLPELIYSIKIDKFRFE